MAPLSIPNKNIFSDHQNLLYEVCLFACDGRQFHRPSPDPAAANPLSSKVSTSQLTNLQCMFGTLWNVQSSLANIGKKTAVVGCYDHYDGDMPDNDRWTSVASLKSTRWRTSDQSDAATALCVWTSSTRNQTGGGVLNRLQPVQPKTQSCSSPGNRRRTPIPMFYSHLQTVTGQLAVAGAVG